MTQISILLLVIVFSLILIRHGYIHKKKSIILFGLLLLIALPLSMYKDNGSFEIKNSRLNTLKVYSEENTIEDIDKDSFTDALTEIDFESLLKTGDKLSDIASSVVRLNKEAINKDRKAENQFTSVKKVSNLLDNVSDFFEFIRGSNIAAVDYNSEDELIVVDDIYLSDESKGLELHIIDVGQGDSMLIKKGSLEILIDAGPNEEGKNVLKYLKGNFVKEIDLVISTHPHEDHIGGMDVVLDNIAVKRVIDSGDSLDTKTYRDYMRAVKESGAELVYDNNLIYDFGDVSVQIIELGDNHKNANENSVVSVISYNGKNILAAGDLEEDLEDELTQILRSKNIKIDFYKASHHGSKTSNSKELLDYIDPEVVVISAGVDNKYKHPNKKAMQTFLDITSRVYSTQKSGNIKFMIKDEIVESKDYYNMLIRDANDF